MSCKCNGNCKKFHVTRKFGKQRYLEGQKRCNTCEIFLKWDGLWCPCCNNRLRLSPRNGKNKVRFLETKSKRKEILANGL